MAQVVLLSDSTNRWVGIHSRYMGPYPIAFNLREKGFNAVVVDYFSRHQNFFEYLKQFIGPETISIGISSTFLSARIEKYKSSADASKSHNESFLHFNSPEGLKEWLTSLRELINDLNPNCKIVLGGHKSIHSIICADYHNCFDEIDFYTLGHADSSFVHFIEDLASGKTPKYRMGSSGQKIVNYDKSPSYNSVPTSRFTKADGIQPGEALPIEVKRGCRFNCKFCYYDKRYSAIKASNQLKEEFRYNFEEFGITHYHFCDDCFNDLKTNVYDICNTILSLNFKIEWISYARPDVAIKFPETLDLMIESGARGLYWGIESLHWKAAKISGKGTSTEKVKEFLLSLKEKYYDKCLFQGSFIAGLVHEPESSIRETGDWLLKYRPLDFLSFSPLEIRKPLPGINQMIDLPDFANDPEKFGFSSLTAENPLSWKHEQTTGSRAQKIAEDIRHKWNQQKGPTVINDIWALPHFWTMGYSWSDIKAFSRDTNQYSSKMNGIVHHFSNVHLDAYWKSLAEEHWRNKNTVQPQPTI